MIAKLWVAALALVAATPVAALNIVPVFDSSLTKQAAAGAIETAFNTVAGDYDRSFGNAATVYIGVGWGEVGGSTLPASAVGASESYLYGYYSYSQVKALLTSLAAANRTDLTLATALAHLPAAAPAGSSRYVVTSAEAKALGLLAPTAAGDDGYIGFSGSTASFGFSPATVTASQYDFEAVAAHEISEVLGRISGVDGGQWRTPFDLFRYSAPATLSYSYPAKTYFSVDGGTTVLEQFNAASSGDRGDWATTSTSSDAFDAFIGHGQRKSISAVDLAALDVIGWAGANAGNTSGTPSGTAFALTSDIPEPATWTLLVAGFGVVGGTLRRRSVLAA